MRLIERSATVSRSTANLMDGRLPGLGGSLAALVTPFRNGDVDTASLAALCERQIRGGTAALVVCGSTGEAPALSFAEHAHALAASVEAASGRVPVIAGCGAPSTDAAVVLAAGARRNGASAVLCSPPPYSRPTQEGIAAHVRAVAHAADLPLIIYDVPSRVGTAIADETIARLHGAGLAVAVKDAGADLSRAGRLRALCGVGLVQLTGDDATAAGHRAMGGHGCISVTANVAPALCAQLHAAWDRADLARFAELRDLLAPLHHALFLESNPIPVKAALWVMGLCGADLRLPLTRAVPATLDALCALFPDVLEAEDAAARTPRLSLVQ